MKKIRPLASIFLALAVLVFSFDAEARVGGGRSSGFRGSRGFGYSQRQQAPRQNHYQDQNSSNYQNRQAPGSVQPQSVGRNPVMTGILGGLAGGFIGSMLFRSLGFGAGPGGHGAGGVGLLEILLLAGLGFFLFRVFVQRKMAAAGPAILTRRQHQGEVDGAYEKLQEVRGTGPFFDAELDQARTLQRYDNNFDLKRFKEQRMDDFLKIQSAWNSRDLSATQGLIAPQFHELLSADVEELKRSRRINKLENIAVRDSELVEAWQEFGKEYATLRFKAQLLDYTIDEGTQAVVAGDRNEPVRFEEEWTFVRNVDQTSANPWTLTAISNVP
ncbi:MAG: Tim44 domain-containing protein [Bdellovibrionota bacterium]